MDDEEMKLSRFESSKRLIIVLSTNGLQAPSC